MVMPVTSPDSDTDMQCRRPFNVSSSRFASAASLVNSNPGPGRYCREDKQAWQHGSIGRKGFGPMVSSSSRLPTKLTYTGPGPGGYCPQHLHSKNSPHAHHPTTRSSSSSNTSAIRCVSSTPPPGAYGVPPVTRTGAAIDWPSSHRPGAAAAFRATARQHVSAVLTPPKLPVLQQQLQQQQQCQQQPGMQLSEAACFRHLAPGRGAAKHGPKQHGAANTARAAAARTLTSAQLARRVNAAILGPGRCTSAPASRCCFDNAAKAAAEVPGVGSYDISSVGAISGNLQRQLGEQCCSSMFAQPAVAAANTMPQQRR